MTIPKHAAVPAVAAPSYRWAARLPSALLLSGALFFPHFLGELGPLRMFTIAIGLFAVAVEIILLSVPRITRLLMASGVVLYVAIALGVSELLAQQLDDRFFAVNAQHLFVMLPLFAFLGVLILRSDAPRVYLNTFLTVASVVAAIAIAESLLDRSLLGRDFEFLSSQREGLTRALVGSEHVLVLGASLAAAAPLAAKIQPVIVRIATSILLVTGCWATGSRAPALLSTAVVIFILIPVLGRFIQRHLWILYSGATVVLGAFAYFSVFVWSPYIAGNSGLEYSANYRWASYSLIPHILAEHPFGYLLGGTPAREWMVGSELRGPVDIGRSADSELLFSVFGLGWIGVALFLIALFVSITAIKRDLQIGIAALTLTAIGFFLALHGWDGMSPLWYLLLGMSALLTFETLATNRRRPTFKVGETRQEPDADRVEQALPISPISVAKRKKCAS